MKRELVFSARRSDFRIDTFRSGGKGGQHQNKTDSGVRITHLPTGLSSESRDSRSQHQNRKSAFKKLSALLVERVKAEQPGRPDTSAEVVRSYNAVDNRVKDHATGASDSYERVVGGSGLDHMILARAKAMKGAT